MLLLGRAVPLATTTTTYYQTTDLCTIISCSIRSVESRMMPKTDRGSVSNLIANCIHYIISDSDNIPQEQSLGVSTCKRKKIPTKIFPLNPTRLELLNGFDEIFFNNVPARLKEISIKPLVARRLVWVHILNHLLYLLRCNLFNE